MPFTFGTEINRLNTVVLEVSALKSPYHELLTGLMLGLMSEDSAPPWFLSNNLVNSS